MKKIILTITLAGLGLWATSETSLAQTNFTYPLNINLTATIAGADATNNGVAVQSAKYIHITTANVISALGTSLGMTNFDRRARLLLTESTDGSMTVAVKDGTNAPVDVSGFFFFEPSTNGIETVSFNARRKLVETNVMTLENFGLQDNVGATPLAWHFNVSGLSTTTYAGNTGTNVSGTVTEDGFALSAQVTGSGDYNGTFALFQGSINAGSDSFDEFFWGSGFPSSGRY